MRKNSDSTGLADVSETYVDNITSSFDLSNLGPQIMGINFLYEQALAQGDKKALDAIKSSVEHFRMIQRGLEGFVTSLETGKKPNVSILLPFIENTSQKESVKGLPAPEEKRVKRKYTRKPTQEERKYLPGESILIREAMKIYPELFGKRGAINSFISHRLIGKEENGRISATELEGIKSLMEGKKYTTIREIAKETGLSEASLYYGIRKGIIDEYVIKIIDSKGPKSVKAIPIDAEQEMIERLKATKGIRARRTVEDSVVNYKPRTKDEVAGNPYGTRTGDDGAIKGVMEITPSDLRTPKKTGYDIVSTNLRQERQLAVHLKGLNPADETQVIKDFQEHFEEILNRTSNSHLAKKFSYIVDGGSILITYKERGRPTQEAIRILTMYRHVLNKESQNK